jgi:predicted CxxxxCH...CXXCH cytochrome family protein
MVNNMNGCVHGLKSIARKVALLVFGVIAFFGITLGPGESQAAIGTTTQNWPATPIYAAAAYPSAAISYNAVAGNNRLLVVGISSSTTAIAQAQPTVTYGGVSMTPAVGYNATATQQHSYLFYLPLGSSATADTGKALSVSISGGTSKYCVVNAAVYTGVDQATPVSTSVRSSNTTTASTVVGPFTLGVASGELGLSVLNTVMAGTTNANASTITIGTTGHLWSQVSTVASARMKGGALRTTFATTSNVNTVTATQHTSSATTLNSTAAMAIKPIVGVSVTNGSTVAGNKNVYVGDANATNVVVDTFTMSSAVATTVTGITFTSNAYTTSDKVSTIKIWRKVGAALTTWEASDVLVASGTPTGGAVVMSANETVSALANYIVTYDVAPTAAASTSSFLTGTVTATTPTPIDLTDTTALSASLYIYPTTTVGNGTNPATARLGKGSAATNMDAFTLAHNGATSAENDTVTSVTVTMNPQYISGGSGSTVSKLRLVEIVNAAGTTVYGSAAAATTGDIWNIPTTLVPLIVTATPTTYYVRVSTANVINPSIDDPSGTPQGYYSFSGKVTDLIHSKSANKLAVSDSGQTLAIDVEKPSGPLTATSATGSTAGTITLGWDLATDGNGGSLDGTKPYVIMRSAPDGTQPAPNCTEGTDISAVPGVTINYGTRTAQDVGLIDTTPTRYYYRICAKDGQGNLSDGAATYANAKVNNICNTTPTVNLTGEDLLSTSQIVKSANSAPFKLMISNNDIGTCPDSDFNIALVNEVSPANFDKAVGATQQTAVAFPTTVKLGTGGAGAPTGKTLNVYITGKPTANQLEVYKFAVQVSEASHGTPPATAQMTAMLNDMPPIVHNSSNMGKFQYGNWGQTYTCATCHSNSTTNIKGIYQVISTPIGRRNVVFTKTSSVDTDYTGVFSNDKRTVNTVSNNVCSVCHHNTRQHQYSASKALLNNGPLGVVGPNGDEAYNTDHHNSRDCVRCHTHNSAFRSIYGLCGDCHGFKATGYSPVSKNTMVKDLTNALGPNPPNYGAHQRHNIAKMTCGTCHSNTNHGLDTTAWQGDNILEIGFAINKDTFPGFNPNASITGGTFYGTSNLNAPFVWSGGPGTTISPIADYNASCNTYCHGQWSGNAGSNTTPIWVGTGQAACGGCHNATGSQPPTLGSHAKHAGNTGTGLGIACSKCHGTYANYTGSAHINGNVEWDMTVAFPGGTYSGKTNGSTNASAPTTGGFGTCSNLYCHSNVQGADGTGAPTSHSTPTWGGTAPCGSCHVVPNTTGSHASHENAEVSFDCHACHNNGGTTTALNHANGTINFEFVGLAQNTVYSLGNAVAPGTAYGTCSNSNCHGRFTRAWGTVASGLTQCEKCHGSRTSNGFYSTRGPTGTLSIYSAGIGVHDIHLQNLKSPRKATFARFTSYATGFNCNQCHRVPSGPFSNGHIDTALPAEVPFTHMSSIANTGQVKFSYYTSPTYNSATQTCSAIWCHGAGMNSNNSTGPYAGLSGSIQRQDPVWNVPYLTGNGAADCVKCHAMPPPAPDANYIHYGKTLANCKECHTHLGSDGLSFRNKALHVNGAIDGGCDKCHGYPPINNIVGDHEGLATPVQGALTQGTAGAHNAHVLNANIGKNCQTCHYNFTADMPSNTLELGFNGFNGTVVSGTFTGYSNSGTHPKWLSTNAGTVIQKVTTGANVCSNLYCHGGGTATLPALGGGIKTNPNWEGGSNDAICGSCHGADTSSAPTGGSHSRHALAINGGVGLLCNSCHGSSVNMTHVNGAVSWALDRTNPAVGANATYNNISSGTIVGLAPRNNGTDYRTCNNVYCHSNVQGTDGTGSPTSYGAPKWGANGSLDCGSCHKNMATDGTATGSHVKHANTTSGMGVACGYCHQDGGSGTVLHADNGIFVNFTSYVGGLYSNGTPLNAGMNKTAGSAPYGTCSATFCHGTVASPTWGTPGPLACNACHGAKVDSPTWSGRHNTHYNYSTMPTNYTQTVTDLSTTTKYRFNCAHCHDDNVAKHSLKPASTNSAARVFFGISSATPVTSSKRGTYVAGTPQAGTDNGFKFTAGSCNTSYCHSNGRGGAPLNTALTWMTTPTAGSNCAYCHDTKSTTATATQLSGKHDKHMNPTNNAMIGTGNGFNCADCHARTITNTNNTAIANKGKHVNAYLDYSGARANKNYNGATKQCSNVYCHSNGNPSAVVFVSMTGSKVWTGAATITTCNKCHGRSNSLGYPDYANGGANTATSNLHAGHLAGMSDTTACADCHRKTPDTLVANKFRPYSTLHLSGGPNVNFNSAKTYIGTKANVATAGFRVTCSQIVCHGQGSPVWGTSTTANQCQKCHGDKTTAFATFSSPQVAPGYNGTGTDTSMVNSAATSPRVGAHQRHLVSNAIANPIKCGECHVAVTSIRAGNHWNYSTATLTFSGRATANSHTPSTVRSGGIIQCSNTNCHGGKYNSGTTIAPFWNMTGLVKETGTTVGACTKCHAMPPSGYASHPAALSDTAAISTIYGACGSCHTNLSSSATNVGNVFTTKGQHINGAIEYVSNCDGCHAYDITGGGTTWTPALTGGSGTGAHIKHLAFIKNRLGIANLTATGQTFGVGEPAAVCGTCHTSTVSEHNNGSRQITFGAGGTSPNTMGSGYGGSMSLLFGSTNPSFNSTGKTCSNLSCHYFTTPSWY